MFVSSAVAAVADVVVVVAVAAAGGVEVHLYRVLQVFTGFDKTQ